NLLGLRIPADPLRPAAVCFAIGLERILANQELLTLLPAHGGCALAVFTLVDPVADQPFKFSERSCLVRRITARVCQVAKLRQFPLVLLPHGDKAVTPREERSAFLVIKVEMADDRCDFGGEKVDRFDFLYDLACRSVVECFAVLSTDRVTPSNLLPILVEEDGVIGENSRESLRVSLIVGCCHGFQ